jgi:hypothetical protein
MKGWIELNTFKILHIQNHETKFKNYADDDLQSNTPHAVWYYTVW